MNRALVLALAFTAIASPTHADTKADAKPHIERGSKAYASGNYRDALRELTLAYALDPDPELLFAIGQINVKLGDCVSATTFYQRFLDTHPAASEASVAHQAIEGCASVEPTPPIEPTNVVQPVKPVVDTTPPVPSSRPVPPPPPPPARPWYSDGAGDVLVGLGILAGGASAVLYGQAVDNRNNADHAATYDAYTKLIDRAHSERAWAIGAGAGAGALVVVGVIHYAIHGGGSTSEPEHGVALAPTRGGAIVGYGASF